uniref:Uncharacterized protein n=1 Tax=Anguilla anguilla TaxID=7936 RepID=A0A0E9VYG7_ANGAN
MRHAAQPTCNLTGWHTSHPNC